MNRHQRIISLLTQEFSPKQLELVDNSHKHVGHAGAAPGGETHYDLLIEAEAFRGLNKVQCHQAIYRVLEPEFKSGLHALSIKAGAPAAP
jgi:BolA family transcriptional regulator, general stress-responsive regulator